MTREVPAPRATCGIPEAIPDISDLSDVLADADIYNILNALVDKYEDPDALADMFVVPDALVIIKHGSQCPCGHNLGF